MATIPKRARERIIKNLTRFKRVLSRAKSRDINESDTVNIITDMLSDLFGYDKYSEITSEFAIKRKYCDLAIVLDKNIEYLIEAKAIGTNLKDIHLSQAINYAANEGVSWVILTNGITWQVNKLKFGKPISYEVVVEFDLTELNSRNEKDLEALYIITKEGVQRDCREEHYQKILNVNRYIIGNLMLSEPVQKVIRRELKKFDSGLKIDQQEILDITENEIVKRDILDSEEGRKAASKVKRHFRKSARKREVQRKKETKAKVNFSPFVANK